LPSLITVSPNKLSTAIVSSSRAHEVREQINQLKSNMLENMLDLGELLAESRDNDYPAHWGFSTFEDWLLNSDLEMGKRTAYYLMKIVDTSRALGIPREELKKSKISKLKEIFVLDAKTHAAEIKQLVADSSTQSLDEVRERVGTIREKHGHEPLTWRNFRVTASQAEIIDQAVERARNEYGHTIDGDTGELLDISDSKALEIICADFIANPDPVLAEIEAIPIEDNN
jgi:hypothetical protein